MTSAAANPPEESPTDPGHEILHQAEVALDRGDARKALDLAKRAYQASADTYPGNYNALSVALDCLEKLELNEEAETIRNTMEKLLVEHNTKPHAEGEARKEHPLREKRGL
jgi:hypothetical protein